MRDTKPNRRGFGRIATGIAAFSVVPRSVLGGVGYTAPSEKLNIAGIGVGGRGAGDIEELKSQNIVALCDVDARSASGHLQPPSEGAEVRGLPRHARQGRSEH